MKKGISLIEETVGTGETAAPGSKVRISYTGLLSKGEVYQKETEQVFHLGKRQVMPAFDYTVDGMRVGGRRKVKVSPLLGYREKGLPGVVPANAQLTLEIELLGVESRSLHR